MTDGLRLLSEVLAAARQDAGQDRDLDPEQLIQALSSIGDLRRLLDGAERDLIARARRHGVGWTRIADSLGLQSRQAAEQRWLRLGDPSGGRDPAQTRAAKKRQHIVDNDPPVKRLRKAVVNALAQLNKDWPHPRAALIRATLEIAVDAPPGGLYALVESAIADLETRVDSPPPASRTPARPTPARPTRASPTPASPTPARRAAASPTPASQAAASPTAADPEPTATRPRVHRQPPDAAAKALVRLRQALAAAKPR